MARKAKPVEKTDSCEGISDEDKMFEVSLIYTAKIEVLFNEQKTNVLRN